MDGQLYTRPYHQDGLFTNKFLMFYPNYSWRWINEKWKSKSVQWNHHRQLKNSTTSYLSSSKSLAKDFTILTKRGSQMQHRFAYLFVLILNTIRSCHWFPTRKVSISFSCNHTQTHILALNLKKIFPVIKFWTMICHTVCVHRTVLCGFKSDFFFLPQLYKDVNFLWINKMMGTSRNFSDFRRNWPMSTQIGNHKNGFRWRGHFSFPTDMSAEQPCTWQV